MVFFSSAIIIHLSALLFITPVLFIINSDLVLVGEGFGPLIQIYPQSVQADLINMKPDSIPYVCMDGAQADTPPLQCGVSFQRIDLAYVTFDRASDKMHVTKLSTLLHQGFI